MSKKIVKADSDCLFEIADSMVVRILQDLIGYDIGFLGHPTKLGNLIKKSLQNSLKDSGAILAYEIEQEDS